MANLGLEILGLSKAFDREQVLNEVSFSLNQGEVLSILGKSGSGKTTLLKVIAGLMFADDGEIHWMGHALQHVSPEKRGIVYLYQEALLFPHLNVFENVAFGLRIRKYGDNGLKQKVSKMLEALDISEHAQKMPNQISGGQKQRVAFGRAMIIEPKLILLDEPFGALDHQTRERMQGLLKRVLNDYQMTAIFVTHDIKEALLMGQSIGRMENGHLIRYDSKRAFVHDPLTGAQGEMDFWKKFNTH